MPVSKHRCRGKARLQWVPPPRPPRHQLTEEKRREDALIEERVRQLYGKGDWGLDEYNKAIRQLEAEGKIRPTSELLD